jgi:DNA (cytosine-5)-methyltransferase 1
MNQSAPTPLPWRLLDLFAGAGGMSLGFHQAGFRSCFAVEDNPAAAASYAANFSAAVHAGAIQSVAVFPSADIIIGGPPCQGFSPLGKTGKALARSELNELWREYLRAVAQVQPAVFVIENVPQFLSSAQFARFLELANKSARLHHYEIRYQVLNAADFGTPQVRRRGIVVGSRVGPPPFPLSRSGRQLTVRDAIGDLPLVPTGVDLHIGRNPTPTSLERYRAVPEGGNRFDLARNRPDLLPDCWKNKPTGTTDVFGRLWWDKPSTTIRTEFYKPEKGRFLHPSEDRPITHREAARIQGFPDDFIFEGSLSQVGRQIGNAVPPPLAQSIAESVAKHLADAAGVGAAGQLSLQAI